MARPRGTGHLYRQKTSRVWWAQWHANGVRHRESTGETDYFEAEKAMQRKIAETVVLGEQAPASLTVADLVGAKLDNEVEEEFKDQKSNRRRWENHLRDALGGIRARDLTVARMREYRRQRRAEGALDSSINRELSVVRAAYRLAYRHGRIRLSDIPYFPMGRESRPRKGFLADGQYQKVRDACRAAGLWLAAAFEVAYAYGWRRSEIFGLRAGQLDFAGAGGRGTIRLYDSKNEEGRLVAMTAKVRTLLLGCTAGKGPDDFVLTRDGNRPVKSHYKAWRCAVGAAGVPGLRLHDLRRTGIRNLRRLGIPEDVAMQVSGHRDRNVFRRYDIIAEDDMVQVAEKLDAGQKAAARRARRGGRRAGSHDKMTAHTPAIPASTGRPQPADSKSMGL